MNFAPKALTVMLAIALAGTMSSSALAGNGGKGGKHGNNGLFGNCHECGLFAACSDLCVLVETTRIIEFDCYKCECEDFCVPCKSSRGCKNTIYPCGGKKNGKDGKNGNGGHKNGCNGKCDGKGKGKGKDGHCGRDPLHPPRVSYFDWEPSVASLRTRKVLYRKTVEVEVPSYKWVLSSCCDGCKGDVKGADIKAGVDVPPPPPVEAELKYGNPHHLPVSFERPIVQAQPQVQPQAQAQPQAQPHEEKRSFTEVLTSFFK